MLGTQLVATQPSALFQFSPPALRQSVHGPDDGKRGGAARSGWSGVTQAIFFNSIARSQGKTGMECLLFPDSSSGSFLQRSHQYRHATDAEACVLTAVAMAFLRCLLLPDCHSSASLQRVSHVYLSGHKGSDAYR